MLFVMQRSRADLYYSLSRAKSSEQEFMQYRFPPLSRGPSSKTCPKCAPHRLHKTSVRRMPSDVSSTSSICSRFVGSVNDGHPVPESNFVLEETNPAPQLKHLYIPSDLLSRYFPVNGASVPFFRVTSKVSRDNPFFHSLSDFSISLFIVNYSTFSIDSAQRENRIATIEKIQRRENLSKCMLLIGTPIC